MLSEYGAVTVDGVVVLGGDVQFGLGLDSAQSVQVGLKIVDLLQDFRFLADYINLFIALDLVYSSHRLADNNLVSKCYSPSLG